ncbi:conserved hypothetical protein [Pediculus humanus corporis]|uniref:Lipase maturation factor n=1 Tax=Pediculus humanus subsp. corporis TaxID=121224 RepID=E0W2V6_PEDHC|nr:uncharacterized protein Phum_PHUM597490 [Pediculus humanus corporis]EEB19962.1 conserved hypothetical protein [Pediculus humanus corporis]
MAFAYYTRNLILRGVCCVYFFAFLSFYLQIPGLYGNNGILPARSQLEDLSSRTLAEKFHKKPTLLWLAPFLGLNTEYMMDVLSLLGIVLSFVGFLSVKFNIAPTFISLWSFYYSLYQVGQTFMWFQWDILLLEVGFLSIFVAPFLHNSHNKKWIYTPADNVTFFLVKWLLFRFMFSSGIVKLQSNCPTWWGLTALNVHFESQPLPHFVSWYMHHTPNWFLKLGTVFTLIVEQLMPFLFFFPLRSVRQMGFFFQVFLQLMIIFTGNYNFFNLLTIVLCFSLLDDRFFYPSKKKKPTFTQRFFSLTLNILVHGFLLYIANVYYSVRLNSKWTIDSEITFTKAEFDQFVAKAVPAGIYIGGVSLLIVSIKALYLSFRVRGSKVKTLLVTLIYIAAAIFLFGISLVPYSVLHKSSNSTIIPSLKRTYHRLEHLQIVNSYGLFRRMTGVGGRPEVIIEGANDLKGPWYEYNFKYKPGNVNSSLPIVAPYQPRVDWQMWFAALGTYHQNPWLMSTVYRLLEGEKTVLQLLDMNKLPFSKPPKYIKGSLYLYHYTPWSQRKQPMWWKRENVGEYFPIFSKDQSSLIDYLKTYKILQSKQAKAADDKLMV